MGQTITLFFGGSWIGILIAIGLMVAFYKWTGSKVVVAVVAVFLIATRFTTISVQPQTGDGDKIEVVGENKDK